MTPEQRGQWQAWARTHDWGRAALFEGLGDGSGPFLCINLPPEADKNDTCAGGHVEPAGIWGHRVLFRDPQTLRDWAGY